MNEFNIIQLFLFIMIVLTLINGLIYFKKLIKLQEESNELLKKLREVPMAIEIAIDESIFNESDYRNTDHLNVWGAKKMGEQVISYFKKKKVLRK